LNKATQAWQIWLKLNAYIYGSQAFAKLFEQPSYFQVYRVMKILTVNPYIKHLSDRPKTGVSRTA